MSKIKRFPKNSLLVSGIVFAVFATFSLLVFSSADTQNVTVDFAEGDSIITDADASGGTAVQFAVSSDGDGGDTGGGDNDNNDDGGSFDGVPIVIYDTDMGPDIDDAIGLGVLHGYQKKGLVKIGAVIGSRTSKDIARYADAINTYYGHPDIPVGVTGVSALNGQNGNDFFSKTYAGRHDHDLADSDIGGGYKLYRRILAESPDQSVVIAHVGFIGSLHLLIESGPDEYSSLSGVELVKRKVKRLAIMGGDSGITNCANGFNFKHSESGALKRLLAKWSAPILQVEGHLGRGITYPGSASSGKDSHPVHNAYNGVINRMGWHPKPNMHTWDPLAAMAAVEPGLFNLGQPSTMVAVGDGCDYHATMRADANGQHRTLGVPSNYGDAEKQKIVDRMVEMATTPR